MKGNRIYREEYIQYNGIEHFLLHYAKAGEKPVLLYLHGGPGSFVHPFAYKLDETWGDICSQVHWDQRGAGKTQRRNKGIRPESIEQMLTDMHGVVEHIKQVYHKDKIVLLGHSWGSVLGSLYILRHPENVAAYIGTGQVVNMMENERFGYQQVKELAQKAGNTKHLKKLAQLGDYPPAEPDSLDFEELLKQIMVVRKVQAKYERKPAGGNMYAMALRSPSMRLSDILSFLGALKVNQELMKKMFAFDLNQYSKQYAVPIHYILGDLDTTTPTPLSRAYFDTIEAPVKRISIIANAGHQPM
ncbi:MAG: alpha/beta hydrolase, partial [Clostridiales bacterium]|nr:alpha/beta hydrolase [Clostridiales bacterium]